jgi:hypothetical protein
LPSINAFCNSNSDTNKESDQAWDKAIGPDQDTDTDTNTDTERDRDRDKERELRIISVSY